MKGQGKSVVRILFLSTGLLLSSVQAVQACATPIFYAKTLNHHKEVSICLNAPYVTYSFGKIGAKHKEMDINVPVADTSYASQNGQNFSVHDFTVKNGNTYYEASAGEADGGKPYASLSVYKGAPASGKLLAEIKLDTQTVVNNIDNSLAESGVPESDTL
ncbi:MAG: hypothetical protein ACRC5V_02200 [Aeromonas sp.]